MNPIDTIGNIFNQHKQQNGNHLDQLQKYCMKRFICQFEGFHIDESASYNRKQFLTNINKKGEIILTKYKDTVCWRLIGYFEDFLLDASRDHTIRF